MSADNPAAARESAGSTVTPEKWLAAITVLSILTQGYVVGIINHGLQLPLIRMFAGEHAFDRDVFMQTMARTYTTAFYPAVGWLALHMPIWPLLFALFVVFRVANVVLAWRLSMALFNDVRAGLFTAALLSVQGFTFAEDIVSDIYLTHGALAQVMTLLSLVLLAHGRMRLSILVAALMFNIHAMHATHLLWMLGMAVLVRAQRRDLVTLALGVLASLIIAAPTVWWMKEAGVLGAPVPADYAASIKAWFPTHFWPSSWGALDWTLLLFPLLGAWPLWKLAGPVLRGHAVARVAFFSLVVAMAGGLAVELFPHPFLIRLHPMRLSWIMALAGAPFMARAAVRMLDGLDAATDGSARVAMATGLFTLLGVAAGFLYRGAYWLTLVPAWWLLARWDAWTPVVRNGLAALVAVAAVLVPAWTWTSSGRELHAITRVETGVHVIIAMGGVMAAWAAWTVVTAFARRDDGAFAPVPWMRLVKGVVVVAGINLAARGGLMMVSQVRGQVAQWREVQEWCAGHLAPGQVVMVPLTQLGLRAFSRQVPAVDFQEGDALFHDPSYAATFIHKLQLYGWKAGDIEGFSHVSRLEPLDEHLDEENARRIGAELGARVAIRRMRHAAWRFPELFRNKGYVVYRLDEDAPR